jgi:hypothetical protein
VKSDTGALNTPLASASTVRVPVPDRVFIVTP